MPEAHTLKTIACIQMGSYMFVEVLVVFAVVAFSGSDAQRQAEDSRDVLDLVDSDDEQIFHDTVPQLPPLANGVWKYNVSLFYSGEDHEDTETAGTDPQPPEQKEEPTEEAEDLVSF
ncbi:hypothetical protein XENOCAPTIV_010593 [Xenoophorus captivus]|uniref:Uncharacterized protein n=1 Tax=Xenoophorus captivus TaxID=1517983 RepID=A0ABV0R0Q9_9TELE